MTLESDKVAESPYDVCPLLVGSRVPAITVQTAEGKPFDLAGAVADKPTVLVFYRGGWWPHCNRQLVQLQEIEPQLAQEGAQLIAVSPDRPEKLRESLEKHKLSYLLLSDSRMAAAKSFRLAYRVDEETRNQLRGYGINLEEASGESHHLLPVPAVFLLGSDGLIRFEYVNPDYRVRLDPEVLLAAVRRLPR